APLVTQKRSDRIQPARAGDLVRAAFGRNSPATDSSRPRSQFFGRRRAAGFRARPRNLGGAVGWERTAPRGGRAPMVLRPRQPACVVVAWRMDRIFPPAN